MIAVVGAGITGLAVARELERRGEEFVIFEASDRPGGVVRSTRAAGRVLDHGPQRLRLSGRVADLVDELGLTDQLITAPDDLDLFVFRAGRLHPVPLSIGRFLASDVVSVPARLRLLLEPLTAPADPDERVDAYFRRKVGDEVYETIVGPLFGGLFGSDPADMIVRHSLAPLLSEAGMGRSLVARTIGKPGRFRRAPACSFRDGMQALPDAMAASLGSRLRLGTRVESIAAAPGGWRVRTTAGTVEAASVVLTAPAGGTAGLLGNVAPRAGAAIGGLRYNDLAVVHLEAETGLRGYGFQVAFEEPAGALRGVTFNDSLFEDPGRRNLYTSYLGGARAPDVVRLPDTELAALAEREFRRCAGCAAAAIAVDRVRMPAWDATWASLGGAVAVDGIDAVDGIELPEGIHVAGSWRSRPGLPGRLAEASELASKLAGSTTAPAIQAATPRRASSHPGSRSGLERVGRARDTRHRTP